MAPLVSVIIPCFNAGRMLEPALASVSAQTYPNLETIFVDNNSTDGSVERAEAWAAGQSRPFRLVRCVDQGVSRARIAGDAHASGDYVQLLDADDALGTEKIALQVAALEADKSADIAYGDWMQSRHTGDGGRVDTVNTLRQQDDQIIRNLLGEWYPPHSYLFRRTAADRLRAENAWNPDTTFGSDIEYSAIAALLGLRFRHVPGSRVQYNKWSSGQATTGQRSYADRLAAFRAIWTRLRALSRRPDIAGRITPLHDMLLDEDWSVWTMPVGSVEIETVSAEQHNLIHVATGRRVEADRREATVATAMLASGQSKALLHHAMDLRDLAPALANDAAGIASSLYWLRREGLLHPVNSEHASADPAPAPATSPALIPAPRVSNPFSQRAVAEAWVGVLDQVSLAQNQRFDAAGGDSMALLDLALTCEARIGVPVPIDLLSVRMRPSDIAGVLDRILDEQTAQPAASTVVSAQPDVPLPKIILIRVRHMMDLSEPNLRTACAGRADVLAVPLPAWPTFAQRGFDFPGLLDRLVAAIEPHLDDRPVRVFGMCLGGFLAYLVAQRLAARGRRIGWVGIVDGNAGWLDGDIPEHLARLYRANMEHAQHTGPVPATASFLARRKRLLRFLHANQLMTLLPAKLAAKLDWHLNYVVPRDFDKGGLNRLMDAHTTLDAPLTVFRTLDQADGTSADLHWRGRCREVTVMPVLGNHYNLFSPEHQPAALAAFTLAVTHALATPAARAAQSPTHAGERRLAAAEPQAA